MWKNVLDITSAHLDWSWWSNRENTVTCSLIYPYISEPPYIILVNGNVPFSGTGNNANSFPKAGQSIALYLQKLYYFHRFNERN